ncbi:MAG: magnesium transporter [Pseudomonadota bacterium]
MEPWLEQKVAEIEPLMDQGDTPAILAAVEGMHPADLAHLMEGLDEGEKRQLFGLLEPGFAADVLTELSEFSRDQVLVGIQTRRLAAIVDDLPSDEATDIIADLPREQAQEVLARINLEDSAEVRQLLQYPEDSAGGIMQLELVSAFANQTVSETIEQIRKKRDEVGELHNVYVVDRDRHLLGIVPLSKMILADPGTVMRRVMEPLKLVVQADEDQEKVAHKFRRYNVVSAPVVDDQERLLGRITIDDVVDVLEEEASEDFMRMAGSSEEDMFYSNQIFKISRLRLPWLLTNLIGGLITGLLLWLFKGTLSDAIYLISFVPVITGMGGNVGIQSSTIMVRGFALGRITLTGLWSVLWKEVRVALVMGVVCGLVVGLVADLWHGRAILGLVVGLAMLCGFSVAALMGTLAPAIFKRLNIDPAISAGPFVTTANDIVGILIYFTFATIFYRYLVT